MLSPLLKKIEFFFFNFVILNKGNDNQQKIDAY